MFARSPTCLDLDYVIRLNEKHLRAICGSGLSTTIRCARIHARGQAFQNSVGSGYGNRKLKT